MFRTIKRADRQLSDEETARILREGEWGVLSVLGDRGYPYGVPMSYGYANGKIYLHSTPEQSHKLDAIRKEPKVCFTVVTEHTLLPESYSVRYRSAIVFGTARILETAEEKQSAMVWMMTGLAPEALDRARDHCVRESDSYAMIEITPEHVTGKANGRK